MHSEMFYNPLGPTGFYKIAKMCENSIRTDFSMHKGYFILTLADNVSFAVEKLFDIYWKLMSWNKICLNMQMSSIFSDNRDWGSLQ